MLNKSILKSIGQTTSPEYGVGGVSDAKPAKNSSIMSNPNTKSDRCGYGVMGVDAGATGAGPNRSSRRSAGTSPS